MADKKDDLHNQKKPPQKKEHDIKDIPESEELKNYYAGLDYIPFP